ncbi:MAG: XdhC family protein [Melioribacteraceae bacterium]|jgi:xanthine dehydrogenase accessory factor|nr:XdhC family protein [Melioribacteraceae bacterium]
MKELKLWKYISDRITSNRNVVLLIVANASNASPGRTGFKMAVADDGTSIGTIGGGIMEFDIISEIKESFSNNKEMNFVRKLHHSNLTSGEKSGLICGGVQTVVFKSLSKDNIEIVENIVSNLEKTIGGVLSLTNETVQFIPQKTNSNNIELLTNEANDWKFEENIGIPNTVYIIGGGHVGLAVSRIMSTLDFHVVIFDHRKSVQTMDENIFANKKVITTYDKISDHITEGNKSYVVVVTPSHDGDKDALKAILKLDLKYIGSMGSAKKIKSIFAQLRIEDFSEKSLEKIHTPIGIEIEAESPEEIAISIAAEIINCKHGLKVLNY